MVPWEVPANRMSDSGGLPSPEKRILYLAAQVNQKSMNDLTKAIIQINDHDRHLEKLNDVKVEFLQPWEGPPKALPVEHHDTWRQSICF